MPFILYRIGNLLGSWKWVLGYTALLLLTLKPTRWFLDWLAERELSGLLGVGLLLAGIGCCFLVLRRIRLGQGELTSFTLLRLLGFMGLYLCCMFFSTDLTADRVHFVEYGVLGVLCFRAVDRRHRTGRRVGYAMVTVFAIGTLDECIQGLLDDRYFALRDLVIDLLAGFLPVLGLLVLPLYPGGPKERVEPTPPPWSPKTEISLRPSKVADVSAVLVALLLLVGALWVSRVSWDLEPLYGEWERRNRCGGFERMQIGRDGSILWKDAAGSNARGTYRVRGNRLDGPLLEVTVLEGQGSDACSWRTGEGRHRYFRNDPKRLVFTKEPEFPFRRAAPMPDS